MSLWILANTVSQAAADFRITDVSNVEQVDPGLNNLRGGPRTWKVAQEGSLTHQYVYVNKAGGLEATHAVIAGASGLAGANIYARSWATYTGSSTIHEFYAPFSEDTYGIDGSDFVIPLGAVSGKDAFGLTVTTSTDTVNFLKLYFCQGLEFPYAQPVLLFRKTPVWAPAVRHDRNYYKLHGEASITLLNCTRAMVDSFLELPMLDPVFLYDETGGSDYGDFLPEKLWHCIIRSYLVSAQRDDLNAISLQVGILKHGVG